MHTDKPSSPSAATHDSAGAVEYWAGNLDAQNLERGEEATPALSLEQEIAFAQTPDFECALTWLGGGPHADQGAILDLGAGLGANSMAMARRGRQVIAADTSLARLISLRQRARETGLESQIALVAASAEALPFATGSLRALYTKSVLIHTELPQAAAQIHRVLDEGGRAALVEPQPGNPLAWLYRKTLAPKIWASITRYFDPKAQAVFTRPFAGRPSRTAPFYLLSFLAFGFQFAWPRLGLFRASLRGLWAVDRLLLKLCPPLARLAWFGVIEVEKTSPSSPPKSS